MRRTLALLALIGTSGAAADRLPLKPARELTIAATRGTWMALDVSPDGGTLIFDLLGDLYRLPAGGGHAEQLTRGLGYDTGAVFSPDGRHIAFVSDRSGADELWLADADARNPRQVTRGGDISTLSQPAWSADGQALFVSRYHADRNNYELWRYALDGAATMLAPIRTAKDAPRSEWRSTLGAAPSADGRWLYYARRVGGLDYDELNAWTIVRRNLTSGAEQTVVAGSGARGADRDSYFAPMPSHDGRLLAYATRIGGHTWLRLRDLATGADRAVTALDPDMLMASMWQGLVPRYVFAPDDRSLLIGRGGRILRVALDGAEQRIDFGADMRVAVGPSTRVAIRERSDRDVTALVIGAPIASPDGRRIAFSAFGAIWTQATSRDARPVRLTSGAAAAQPSWSADGRTIAYVTWSETSGGQVWTIPADGTGAPCQVTTLPAFYTYPVFAPGGDALLVVRSAAAARQATGFEYGRLREAELVRLPLDGGAPGVVMHGRIGGRPQFTDAPGLTYLLTGDGLAAIDLASGRSRTVAQVTGAGWYFAEGNAPADDIRITRDGRWLVAQAVQQLYVVANSDDGSTIDLTAPTTRSRRITTIGADAIEIGARGTIDWTVGHTFQRVPLAEGLPGRSAPPRPRDTVTVRVAMPRVVPHGAIVLRGARVLTMAAGDRVIADADVVVSGDRIVAVGARGTVPVPSGATIRDVSGKTILPGFVDEHDHIGEARRDVPDLRNWGLEARLAYGITTSFDPSTLSLDQLALQDMIDAGLTLGPRLRSTGPALFSMQRFTSLEQVRAVLRRYRDAYGLSNIKEYRTGDRRVRQWVAIAAKELGLHPTTEGALSMKLDLTQILDGFAASEHALPATPLGDDVLALLAAQRTGYSTTLMITNSGYPAADWFAATRDPAADAKLRRFWPQAAVAQKLGARTWHPFAEQRFPVVAADAARVAAAGGVVGMGAHGEMPGIGFHYEMLAHAAGGMAPMAVLHAATAGSAEVIGRLTDLGTVEPGKLADLVVLNADPLADVANTRSIDAVMRGGTLYDAATLATLWPSAAPAPPPPFDPAATVHWLPLDDTPARATIAH
jgi:Tol biopolymer transport system component/cytosine/adenosine deaminase-related metal-dependent hydrolase